jgi:hypothetical protein
VGAEQIEQQAFSLGEVPPRSVERDAEQQRARRRDGDHDLVLDVERAEELVIDLAPVQLAAGQEVRELDGFASAGSRVVDDDRVLVNESLEGLLVGGLLVSHGIQDPIRLAADGIDLVVGDAVARQQLAQRG